MAAKKRTTKKSAAKKRPRKRAARKARASTPPTHDHGNVDTSHNPHGEGYELWDFLPAFVHAPGVHETPHEHEVEDADFESQCGGADDSQPVEQYDGTLGVTQQFVSTHQRPVGQLQWNSNLASIYDNPGNVTGVRWCTGTLISCDLFLTAGHCFDQTGGGWIRPTTNGTNNTIPPSEIATNMHVNMNYQVDPNGVLRPVDEYAITDLIEFRLGGLDFAVVRLAGNPGAKYGFTRISSTDAASGEMLCIIQHPAGWPKRIEAGPLTDLHGGQLGYNDIDTLGGSSGSGVLGSGGKIVGVHTNGGCDPSMTGHNHGTRISSIIAVSSTVANLATTKQKFMDDGCGFKLKAVDDPIKYSFFDRKFKFFDDPIKSLVSDLPKGIGDVKFAGYDRRPFDPGAIFGNPFGGTRSPFILSTPHHSEAFGGATRDPHGPHNSEAQLAAYLQWFEGQLSELHEGFRQLVAALEQQGGGSGQP